MAWIVFLKIPLIVLQAIITPILVLFVMLQSGKGDDMSALAGAGGGSSSVLGTGGASKLLTRGTAILAVIFMINCVALAKIFREEANVSVGAQQPEPIVAANAIGANGIQIPVEAPKNNEPKPSEPAKK